MKKRYDVFISYRRDHGGKELALLMHSELEKRGYTTFLDVKCLKDNTFGPQIMEAIDAAPVFVFIMSENSLERCVDENDWVRREILYAVGGNRHIVPVNPNGHFKEFPAGLPQEIYSALSENQQSEINLSQLFESSVDKMVAERIRPYLRRRKLWRWLLALILALAVCFFIVKTIATYRGNMYEGYIEQYNHYWSEYLRTQDPAFKEKADYYWAKASAIRISTDE